MKGRSHGLTRLWSPFNTNGQDWGRSADGFFFNFSNKLEEFLNNYKPSEVFYLGKNLFTYKRIRKISRYCSFHFCLDPQKTLYGRMQILQECNYFSRICDLFKPFYFMFGHCYEIVLKFKLYRSAFN